ncbi:hypothetical protein MSZK_03010 [Mycobacterium sp. shizuoka-1]|nr:hypothetical protein MSZK_03010 [Mycobacterium sp. shizuoka-1]
MGAAGSATAATAVGPDCSGWHTVALAGTGTRVVSNTPGSEDSGASVTVVGVGVDVEVGAVPAVVDASMRTAVPALSREHAATPGRASITTAVAAHTSRVTTSV